jgi:phage-related baseplate assembly protein
LDRKKFLQSNNPFTNNLYLLGYNSNRNLTQVNPATLQNLITYLQNYKILTDKVNIIDGYIINIGIQFKISVFKGFNKSDVLNTSIQSVKDFFLIDNWSFNQPINLSQLNFEIMQNEGVQSVIEIEVRNLTIDDGDYSPIAYNISVATQNNIVYPSKDPSVFEVKYPDIDIKGIVV